MCVRLSSAHHIINKNSSGDEIANDSFDFNMIVIRDLQSQDSDSVEPYTCKISRSEVTQVGGLQLCKHVGLLRWYAHVTR